MTNSKSTKRALFASVIALLLCFTMLLGTTYAWFTDSATSGSNVIQSGTLDIVLEYWNGTEWADAEGQVLEFKKASTSGGAEVLWEPGCTYELPKIRVRNEGNLAAYVLLRLNGVTGNEKLMEAIELTTTVSNIPATILSGSQAASYEKFLDTPVDMIYGTPDGTVIFDWSLMAEGVVSPNSGHTDTSAEFTVSGHMKEDAGSEYQGLKIEGVSITALATQQVYEYDSFSRYYDENATLADVWDGSIGTVPTEVDGVVTITTAAEFAAFANDVNVNKNSYAGKTVLLANDIDLNNMPWTPIGQTDNGIEFKGTFDGQGHTIKNLYINSAASSKNYSSGLFGWIESHNQDITIKNVNVDGATVIGHHNVAVIAGYMEGDSVVENCHVTNATLTNTHADGDQCGDKTGVIAGYVAGEVTVKGCTATDCTVAGGRDAGQLLGASYVVPADCSATNVAVSATSGCTDEDAGANVANDLVGRKLGSKWN